MPYLRVQDCIDAFNKAVRESGLTKEEYIQKVIRDQELDFVKRTGIMDSHSRRIIYADSTSESAATPMPSAKLGLAGAGSLAKSLTPSTASSSPKLGGQIPKMSTSGSVFAEMIERVLRGDDPRLVAERHLDPRSIEIMNSEVSPMGQIPSRNSFIPGMQIGLRGPTHQGHHAVVSVNSSSVVLKNSEGREEDVPFSDLEDHEVIHNLENL